MIRLEKHISYRFLTDTEFWYEMIAEMYPDFDTEDKEKMGKVSGLYETLNTEGNKNYYITHTILNKLEMLKIHKKGEYFDYTVFNHIPNGKYTFILEDQKLIRVLIRAEVISITHLKQYSQLTQTTKESYIHWILYWANRQTGVISSNIGESEVREIEEFIYKLLCFFFLAENEEIIVQPKAKYGTKKNGKVINVLSVPLVIVNNNWNITSIRNESFGVKGHFALRWTGQGRKISKIVFIEPFKKHGYVRHAIKPDNIKV